MKKKGRLLIVLLTVLLSAILSAVCAALVSCAKNDGADGKNGADGIDGKNAVVDVSDDGFIVVDGNKTEYRFNQKDCKIKITRENALYGEVTGGGEYSYGTAVMLTATPNDGGVFVAWKDLNGNVIGKDKNLLAVADRGETEYTAQFACSPENVTARINVKFDETTLNNAVYTGDAETPILNGATLKFSGYGENALVLYSVDLQTFEKESAKINEDILNGKVTGGKIIAYEQFIKLFNEKEFYSESTRDFYYYVAGRANSKYSVKVASSDVCGSVTLLGGGKIDADKNYLAGTVLKLKAQPETEKLNGKTVEISDFSGWVIDGKKTSYDKELVYTVNDNAEIVAEFIPKTKLSLTVKSGEAGLTEARYPEFRQPPFKAAAEINGESIVSDLSFAGDAATIDLGYFSAGETFTLQLKLYCKQTADFKLCDEKDTWRYIRLLYEYSGVKIGEGDTLAFFVPKGVGGKLEIGVNYVRTCNYYSNATNGKGENAKESLAGSGYGLI